jgi:hypothetical protein
MKDWEAYKLITELIDGLNYSSPPDFSMDAADGWYDAVKAVERQLRQARDPYKDRLYAVYEEHEGFPWCDTCGGAVQGFVTGFEHVETPDPWVGPHEITLKEYHFGSEAKVEKRLRFEIEN